MINEINAGSRAGGFLITRDPLFRILAGEKQKRKINWYFVQKNSKKISYLNKKFFLKQFFEEGNLCICMKAIGLESI